MRRLILSRALLTNSRTPTLRRQRRARRARSGNSVTRVFDFAMSIPTRSERRDYWRVLLLLWGVGAFSHISFAQKTATKTGAAKTPTVSVQAYRAQLQDAISQLRQIETTPQRRLAPVLKTLAKTQYVKRADGQTQIARDDEWTRRIQNSKTSATRSEVKEVREAVELRLRALDAWSASTYTPEDAQSIIQQLEGSGQIRTGPTRFQQWVANFNKWLSTTWRKFTSWVASLFPTATPGKMPNIDVRWVRAFFALTVFALLALLAYLVWRAIGGRMGRGGAQRGVLAEGEDAELLLLPPDVLRERARKYAGEGNYREALRHLYVSLLLTLDARGVWRYDARRTNWEHIRDLRRDQTRAGLISPLSEVTRVFDRVRYGNAEFDSNDWTRFESEVTKVETQTATP
jgi:hypothetical protein